MNLLIMSITLKEVSSFETVATLHIKTGNSVWKNSKI